tara:strand:+ start:868 stop:1233 length:366 start_codon:yes stop_codon:yes gene_type:complete
MKKIIAVKNSFDLIIGLIAFIGFLAVLETFIFGKHYIIPTAILFITIILANLSFYGFKKYRIAKKIMFWLFFLLDMHLFFALFFSVKYRALLGNFFEIVCSFLVIILSYLLLKYQKQNELF